MGHLVSFASRASLFSREELDELRTGNLKEDTRLTRALMGLADSTSGTYRAALRQFDKWLCGRQVSDECLANFVMHLHEKGRAPSTIAVAVSAVRFRCKALRERDPCGPETSAMRSMTKRRGCSRGRGQAKPLTLEQVQLICETASATGSLWGIRDAALIAATFGAGLRISETAALEVRDLEVQDDGRGLLTIRKSKTDQYGVGAVCSIPASVVRLILEWLRVSGISKGALFRAVQTCGLLDSPPTVTDRGMVSIHIGRIIKKRAEAAGIEGASGHSLRRGFAQSLAAKGLRDFEIQHAGRWSDSSMVALYTKAERASDSTVADALEW